MDRDHRGQHRTTQQHPSPSGRRQATVREQDHRRRHAVEAHHERPHTEPPPPRARAGGGVVADLAAEEHHRLDHPGRQERQRTTVPWLLVEDVGADAGERQPEQPVVEVLEPRPSANPAVSEDDDRAHRQECEHSLPSRRSAHGSIIPAPGRGAPGLTLDLGPNGVLPVSEGRRAVESATTHARPPRRSRDRHHRCHPRPGPAGLARRPAAQRLPRRGAAAVPGRRHPLRRQGLARSFRRGAPRPRRHRLRPRGPAGRGVAARRIGADRRRSS